VQSKKGEALVDAEQHHDDNDCNAEIADWIVAMLASAIGRTPDLPLRWVSEGAIWSTSISFGKAKRPNCETSTKGPHNRT
jgi:hypothetical protein